MRRLVVEDADPRTARARSAAPRGGSTRTGAALVLLIAALLGACAEMRTPPPASRIPPGLGVVAADPVPVMAAEAASGFANGGTGLAGRPGATARAVGQIEFVAQDFARDPRWSPLPTAVGTELRTARLEWRAALGIRAGAAPDAVAAALGRTAIALGANDTRAAIAALDAALFEPGGAPNLARLAAPGPLPQSAIASRVARDASAAMRSGQLAGPAAGLDPDAGRAMMPGGPGSEGLPALP